MGFSLTFGPIIEDPELIEDEDDVEEVDSGEDEEDASEDGDGEDDSEDEEEDVSEGSRGMSSPCSKMYSTSPDSFSKKACGS